MGRPVNKRFFGEGPGNQIKVRAKVGANAEGNGFIVRQRSTNRFEVNVAGNVGVCKLVDKDTGSLAANEMIVTVQKDDGTQLRATKLFNRTLIAGGNKVRWTFEASTTDGLVQIADVEGDLQQFFTVTFDLGDGSRTGGGALEQTIGEGEDAVAPEVEPDTGFVFTGWDVAFTNVQGNITVTAQYAPE